MGVGDERVVLVAEDSMVVRALLRAQLRELGYTVVDAADGEQALERAREAGPDVILLDIEMPVPDGFGVLGRLQEDPLLSEVPVIFITSRTSPEEVARGLGLGAYDYLRKPFEPAELAARVHAAVRTKRLQDQLRDARTALEHQATADQLTGLYNRRVLDEELERACATATRHTRPLALLLVDADDFKGLNDREGHAGGDAALVALAACLRGRVRTEDILGRWGGEEFMVIAPDTDAGGAATLAEGLRAAVERSDPPLTASVGWAIYLGDGPDGILRRADEALYDAKASGRNRAVGAAPAA